MQCVFLDDEDNIILGLPINPIKETQVSEGDLFIPLPLTYSDEMTSDKVSTDRFL